MFPLTVFGANSIHISICHGILTFPASWTPYMHASQRLRFGRPFADIVHFTNLHTRRRIVFDPYLNGSLKETTIKNRTIKTAPVHYHANDNINK